MILYHITPRKNLESIFSNGLIPLYKDGLNCLDEKEPVVWLTDDPDYVLEKQAGDRWIQENDPVVLSIDCSLLDIKPRIVYDKVCRHEYYYRGTIKQDFGICYEQR